MSLRGVNNGKAYPLFWIDTFEDTPTEDALQRRKEVKFEDVLQFFSEYKKQAKLPRVFLPKDTHIQFAFEDPDCPGKLRSFLCEQVRDFQTIKE